MQSNVLGPGISHTNEISCKRSLANERAEVHTGVCYAIGHTYLSDPVDKKKISLYNLYVCIHQNGQKLSFRSPAESRNMLKILSDAYVQRNRAEGERGAALTSHEKARDAYGRI
jgi:hypothetical protein